MGKPVARHAPLLSQHFEDMLDNGFAPVVDPSACRIARLSSHAAMPRIAHSLLLSSATIESASQIRIRNVGVDPGLLHRA
jgi:hypothetical protein